MIGKNFLFFRNFHDRNKWPIRQLIWKFIWESKTTHKKWTRRNRVWSCLDWQKSYHTKLTWSSNKVRIKQSGTIWSIPCFFLQAGDIQKLNLLRASQPLKRSVMLFVRWNDFVPSHLCQVNVGICFRWDRQVGKLRDFLPPKKTRNDSHSVRLRRPTGAAHPVPHGPHHVSNILYICSRCSH